MSILKERNMRIWSSFASLLAIFFSFVALMSAGLSFAVGLFADSIIINITGGLLAVGGVVLSVALILQQDAIVAFLRRAWWQRWGTSPIRRHLVQLREKLGQRMAHMTLAHMGQVIARLSGETNDLHEKVRFLVVDRMALFMQIRSLKRAKEACIKQARDWKALADLWQAACLRQEAELRYYRSESRKRTKRVRFAADQQAWGNRPMSMSCELWRRIVKVVEVCVLNDRIAANITSAMAEIEIQTRIHARYQANMELGLLGGQKNLPTGKVIHFWQLLDILRDCGVIHHDVAICEFMLGAFRDEYRNEMDQEMVLVKKNLDGWLSKYSPSSINILK